jgi:DNA-binding CsgD family transcriptional regulator
MGAAFKGGTLKGGTVDEVTPAGQPEPCCCHTEHFTERELDVLCQIAAGATNEEVATNMNISGHTVAGHLRMMLSRSKARNRAELVARAYAVGVLLTHTWPPLRSGRRCLQRPARTANSHPPR